MKAREPGFCVAWNRAFSENYENNNRELTFVQEKNYLLEYFHKIHIIIAIFLRKIKLLQLIARVDMFWKDTR